MQSVPTKAHQQSTTASSDNEFIFAHKGKVLTTQGLLATVSNEGKNHDQFINAVKTKLAQLEQAGHQNPIMIGAIPFDTSHKTQFYFPEKYQFTPKLDSSYLNRSHPKFDAIKPVTQANHYAFAVSKALSLFEKSKLNKVVLSRAIDVESQTPLDPLALTAQLYQQNPSAYVFCIPQSNGKTLLGASPELLIRRNNEHVFSNPLAGSRKRVGKTAEDDKAITDELWHCEKDRYEHKLVADAVKTGLEPYCSSLDCPSAPSIIHTPTMWHLSTKVQGTLKARQDASALELAYQLHPTPAVCGSPFALAKVAIEHLEGYDREHFCGAVGWMDAKGNGEWVVTIRCGVLSQNSIRLYAGAGVVTGSDPQFEYLETEAKLNTMLNAFGLANQEEQARTSTEIA